jgi:hypothetical protein
MPKERREKRRGDMIIYCPVCKKEEPMPGSVNDLFGEELRVPKICLSCRAKNSALVAEYLGAKKAKLAVNQPP